MGAGAYVVAMTRWLVLLVLVACAPRAKIPAQTAGAGPRGVVLVIGDGMGPGQVALLLQVRPDGAYARLARAGAVGLVDATPYGALVADSAAGGSALATGVQTRPRMIAVDPEGRRVETLVEAARRLGRATGVVTTADLTDATPAAFLSHRLERTENAQIAAEERAAPPTIAIGGGAQWFANAPPAIHALGDGDLPFRGKRPPLAELAQRALHALDQAPGGFVLVVEAALIDSAGHANQAPELLGELLDLDDALAVLAPRAARGEILLVVTADHETGGFGLQFREPATPPAAIRLATGVDWLPVADFGSPDDLAALGRGETPPVVTWSTHAHTAALIPIVAHGPGAARFAGLHAQWEIGQLLRAAIGDAPTR